MPFASFLLLGVAFLFVVTLKLGENKFGILIMFWHVLGYLQFFIHFRIIKF
jgi:hypothetical protein